MHQHCTLDTYLTRVILLVHAETPVAYTHLKKTVVLCMRSKCMYKSDHVFSSRTSICRPAERGGLDKTLQNLQQGAPLSTLYTDQTHEIQQYAWLTAG